MDNRTIDETALQTIVEKPMGGKTSVIMDSQILTALMTCGRYTDFRFNHNLQSIKGKSNSLECGSIVHTFLEFFYKARANGIPHEQAVNFAFTAAELYIRGCPHCTDFIGIHHADGNYNDIHICDSRCVLKPPCGHQVNQFPGVMNTPKDTEGYKLGWQYVLDVCDQYQKYYINDHWSTLEVEIVKGKVIYEDDEVRVMWKAKYDWIVDSNQGIFPVDHKTMKQRRLTNSMNNQFMGQALLVGSRQVIINKIGFQTTLEPKDKFVRVPVSYTPARLLEWQTETVPFYAKMLLMYAETGHYPPNFSNCEGKYGDCPFYEQVCSNDPDMREEALKLNFKVGPEWNPTNEGED